MRRLLIVYSLLFFSLVLAAAPGAIASDSSAGSGCSHPNFVSHECLALQLETLPTPTPGPGAQGLPGIAGARGAAGLDGAMGATGADGEQGPQGDTGQQGPRGRDGQRGRQGSMGLQGPAGEVPEEWIREVRNYRDEFSAVAAANAALDVQTPTAAGKTRMSVNIGHAMGEEALGLGVAYRFDSADNAIVALGVATASGETVVRGSFGFEW